MTDYIVAGGPFQVAAEKLLATSWELSWQSGHGQSKAAKASTASKTKFTCGACGLNAWAKPSGLWCK